MLDLEAPATADSRAGIHRARQYQPRFFECHGELTYGNSATMFMRLFTATFLTLFFPPLSLAAVSCGDILFASDTLTGDLNCTTGSTGVEIRGDNVILDLNGHTLGGNIFQAVLVTGDRVTVRGPGTIKGFDLGVQAHDVSGLTINDIDLIGLNSGIAMTGATGALVKKNRLAYMSGIGVSIRGHEDGTAALPAIDNHVLDNKFYRIGTAINVCGYNATHQLIARNTFERIIDFGIQLETGANHNEIYNNRFYELDNTGIRLSNANMNKVTGNYLKTGRLGLAIHDNNGATSPSCAQPPSLRVVTGNVLDSNTVINHQVAASLGLGITTSPVVLGNQVDNSKFYDNQYGVWFREDAWRNQALGNAYTGTAHPIVDAGTGNTY